MQKGQSLLEILVVISIFAILGILITQSVILSVSGSKKSESLVRVRESLNYSLSVMERQIRNADSIPDCPNLDTTYLAYTDQDGNSTYFQCLLNPNAIGTIASGSASLTGSDVNVTGCSLACTPGQGSNPSTVTISLEAKDSQSTGAQNSAVTLTSQINLRNY